MRPPLKTQRKFERLRTLLQGRKGMLIVLQDFPDPDAIAAGAALRALANTLANLPCSLAHGGVIVRAENKALVDYLDLNLRPLRELDLSRFDLIALVDTQPGTGNNSLPPLTQPHIVLDHHPFRRASRSALYTDVRSQYGATSTLLTEYLAAGSVSIEPPLATALVYGILSDTQNLSRQTTRRDVEAYLTLYPLANRHMLAEIQRHPLPAAWFALLVRGIFSAQRFGPRVVASLGQTENPDMIAELADLLLRVENTAWALSMGIYGNRLLLSLRAIDPDAPAGRVIRHIIGKYGTGGGHECFAGGQIPLDSLTPRERHSLDHVLLRRFLHATGPGDIPPTPLVSPDALSPSPLP